MSRQMWIAVLVVLTGFGSLAVATAQESKSAGSKKQITNSIGMKLVLIPAGEFMMGSGESAEETAAFFKKNSGLDYLWAWDFRNEHPQHRVRITKPFYLGNCHVTRGQFRKFVKDSGYKTDAENGKKPGADGWDAETGKSGFNKDYSWRNAGFQQTDEHPVVNVSWNDAMAFCHWLSRKEGKTYRLPTEAEWEYACRAGTTTRYYNGDDPEKLAEVANVADATARAKYLYWTWAIKASDGYVFTAPVGQFKPNAVGLYDTHGNAWEWCADWYDADYYSKSPTDDPTGPDTGNCRILRGGSWNSPPDLACSAERNFSFSDQRNARKGFRVARNVLPSQPFPPQIMIPDAPKTARDIGPFRSLTKAMTMADVVRKCGLPDEHRGSGLYIFVYYLRDNSTVIVCTGDLKTLHITYGDKSGKSTVLIP